MKKTKITLTADDLKLGPTALMKRYGFSSRGHAGYVLKKGYFWENYLTVEEIFSPEWVEENISEIKRRTRNALYWKSNRMGVCTHRLFNLFKDDLLQDGLLYVIQKAGEIQSGEKQLSFVAQTGIGIAINKYFRYGDGANTTPFSSFLENNIFEEQEEGTELLIQKIKEELTFSFGEKAWHKVWSWANSRKSECPEDVFNILKAIAL